MWSTLLAVLHLTCLPCGLVALLQRARSLAVAQSIQELRPVFFWDNLYGLTGVTWIVTGILRLLGGTDKGTDYYLNNHVFWLKVALVLAVLALEARPLAALIRARIAVKRALPIDVIRLRDALLPRHHCQAALIVVIVISASSMARGIGAQSSSFQSQGGDERSRGQAIYAAECAHCHGMDGRGDLGRVAADFVGDKARLAKSDSTLLSHIEEGVPGTAMLGFGEKLSSAERRAVLAYIRAAYGAKP